MTADYPLYQEREIDPTPIFWATLEAWKPPSEVEQVWLVLEIEVNRRFASAIEAVTADSA